MVRCERWTGTDYLISITSWQGLLDFTRHVSVPLLSVETVLGMMTNLPCNITPSVPGDQVLIVLWYKDGYGKPIYSFDLRPRARGQEEEGKLWASEDGDNTPRAQLNVNSRPTAFLALFGVKEKDGGTYRCRVDFKKSPTRFWKVQLTVIGGWCFMSPAERERRISQICI